MENLNLAKLYYRYKRTSDEDIRKYLDVVRLVELKHNGPDTPDSYYPLTKKAQDTIAKKPRGISFGFGSHETESKPMEGLIPWKKVPFLVKSSSRFFLKDDIGEVFDQIDIQDFYSSHPNTPEFKAICLDEGYELLDGTDGEHFIMRAILLK